MIVNIYYANYNCHACVMILKLVAIIYQMSINIDLRSTLLVSGQLYWAEVNVLYLWGLLNLEYN